jgi:hypothetical protein
MIDELASAKHHEYPTRGEAEDKQQSVSIHWRDNLAKCAPVLAEPQD